MDILKRIPGLIQSFEVPILIQLSLFDQKLQAAVPHYIEDVNATLSVSYMKTPFSSQSFNNVNSL